MGTSRHGRGGGAGRRWRVVISVFAAVLMVLSQQLPANADDPLTDALRRKQDLERAVQVSRANVERYKQAASQFESQVAVFNARIGELAAKQAEAKNAAEALGYEIAIAEEQLQLVAFQLDETRALEESLKAQLAAESRQLADREAVYAKHLKVTYRQAQISPLEMLLSSGSLSEFASRVQALILINRQDAQLANEIRGIRERTKEQQALAETKAQEIVGLQAQVTKQREALAKKKAEYDAVVAAMQNAIDEQATARQSVANDLAGARANQRAATGETAQLNRQLEAAEANYAFLAAQLAARSGLQVFNGRTLNTWPLRGQITSGFGARWGGFHNGLDIAAPMYTPIVAAAPGQVVTVGRPYIASGDTAVVVIIAHGSNFSTLYGHLSDDRWPIVRVGQRVNAGQIIAYVGMTGWTTGPHLHFMTIVDGRAQDPLRYLP